MSRVKLCLEFSFSFGVNEHPGGSSWEDQKENEYMTEMSTNRKSHLALLLRFYLRWKFERRRKGGRRRREKNSSF